jgi:hypothetical protein
MEFEESATLALAILQEIINKEIGYFQERNVYSLRSTDISMSLPLHRHLSAQKYLQIITRFVSYRWNLEIPLMTLAILKYLSKENVGKWWCMERALH